MTKAKEFQVLHDLVIEVTKEHATIIQTVISECITPATTVTVSVGKDDNNKESIIVVFDNSVLRYTGSVDLDTYIDTCLDHDVCTAIKSVIINTLKGFTDIMFDLYFKPVSEVDKILKNIK